jgi:hypothetical protein
VETSKISSYGWMDLEKGVYMHIIEYYSDLKKEGSTICDSMGEHWVHNAKWNEPGTAGQILHDYTYISYLK